MECLRSCHTRIFRSMKDVVFKPNCREWEREREREREFNVAMKNQKCEKHAENLDLCNLFWNDFSKYERWERKIRDSNVLYRQTRTYNPLHNRITTQASN